LGTTIGMGSIKQRRLNELRLTNHPELTYRGGQGPILHLEADLHAVVQWAQQQGLRWAFTLSNAGAYYFEDRCDLAQLGEIDWTAVQTRDWKNLKEGKQAEFLVERALPWHLVERIGVKSASTYGLAMNALASLGHRPPVELRPEWYY
jgi:hypothetical protein